MAASTERYNSLVFIRFLFNCVNFPFIYILMILLWFKIEARLGFRHQLLLKEPEGRVTKQHEFVTIFLIFKFLKIFER